MEPLHKEKKHLLIVGGTGFIGSHLAEYIINKGWKVSSLSRKSKKNKLIKKVKYIYANISYSKNLKEKLNHKFTHVVNLCGYNSNLNTKKEKNMMFNINFVGLLNLINILSNKNIERFVQIGSSAEYGNAKSPLNENKKCNPNSYYGLLKLKSSKHLLRAYKRTLFPVIILRLFNVYGPGQNNNFISEIITGCSNKKVFSVSKAEQIRDFIYIDDVIHAIFLSLNNKKNNGEVFNIASGNKISLKMIIKIIRKIIKKGKPQFGKIKYRKNENMRVFCNPQKAKKKLKWVPKVKIINGILKTIKYHQQVN